MVLESYAEYHAQPMIMKNSPMMHIFAFSEKLRYAENFPCILHPLPHIQWLKKLT